MNLRADQIAAAKQRFAALPEWRRIELMLGSDRAQQAAIFHTHYERPQ